MNDTTIAETASTQYAGWPLIEIFGVGPDGTCHCQMGANCRSAGKHPRLTAWQHADRVDVTRMRRGANLGVRTGEPAGFFVLDIDQRGLEDIARLVGIHGPLPTTRVHKTGSGTFHYFFAMPDFEVTNSRGELPATLDIRGTGGQVVLPPSVSGKGPYSVVRDAPVAPAPAWILDAIRPETKVEHPTTIVETVLAPVRAQTERERAYEAKIVAGETSKLIKMALAATPTGADYKGDPWDETTYRVACQLVELANGDWSALTVEEARQIVLEHAPRDANFTDEHVEAKFASARKRVGDKGRAGPAVAVTDNTSWMDDIPAEPTRAVTPRQEVADHPRRELNDVGNALRLVDRHGDEIRWAADAATWVAYNGRCWDDLTAETVVKRLAIATVDEARDGEAELHDEEPDEFDAKGEPKSSPRQRFYEWVGKSKFEARLKAMANVAQPDLRIECLMDDFDQHTNLLNTGNCVVDLRDGSVRPHSPELMLKAITACDYVPDAKAPLFEAFMARVQPSATMRDYLQTVAGYSVTGETSEQAMFLHNGHGANGKSVFLEIIREVMGGMGQKMARDTLMSKNGQSAGVPSDIAAMAGARILMASETAAGKKLDDERIKELVGGEAQRARHLYGKWFDFRPTGKIHLATNHLPVMESGGQGMARRLRVIPWDITIPDEEQDKALKSKIIATEAEGVLAWLVRGAQRWYAEGLATPTEVRDRTEEHVEDADPLWPFIHDRLVVEADAATEFTAIYSTYASWAEFNGQKAMSGKALTQGLAERLGHESRFKATATRRSMFRVRVRLQEAPTGVKVDNTSWLAGVQ